jgi:hypothetical protein
LVAAEPARPLRLVRVVPESAPSPIEVTGLTALNELVAFDVAGAIDPADANVWSAIFLKRRSRN